LFWGGGVRKLFADFSFHARGLDRTPPPPHRDRDEGERVR